MMQWFGQAPANIALIKYMGKKDTGTNVPINASLSYTLDKLATNVAIEAHPGRRDHWEPLDIPGTHPFELSKDAQARYLAHLDFLKQQFGYDGHFVVRSSNNFPLSCGLASSASSFAALTKCAVRALTDLTKGKEFSDLEMAKLSQHGSGSSVRSFFKPWCLWREESIETVDFPYENLLHQVIIISHEKKAISSSKAHQLVKTSNLYSGRAKRAEENLRLLTNALNNKDWFESYRIAFREFTDMHQLFATCDKKFVYMTEECNELLFNLQKLWEDKGDGPIITMDAGPNIHLLYRQDQADIANAFKQDYLQGNYDIF